MGTKAILIGAMLLTPGVVLGADDALERARRCAAEADSLQRLVCYDRVFAPGAVPAAAPSVAAPPAARPPAPVAPPVVVPAAPPAPVASTASPPAPNQDFGSDQLRRAPPEAEAAAAPRSLTASVQQVRETRPNVFRITLDNGQVWQQMDMDSVFHVQAGDTVEINRGRLGGYRMARQTRGGSGWVRVSRVK